MPALNPVQFFVFSSNGERKQMNRTHENESIGTGMTTPEKWVGRANGDCGFVESMVYISHHYLISIYYVCAWDAGHWRYTGGWVVLLLKSSCSHGRDKSMCFNLATGTNRGIYSTPLEPEGEGLFCSPLLITHGFIHCSDAPQYVATSVACIPGWGLADQMPSLTLLERLNRWLC